MSGGELVNDNSEAVYNRRPSQKAKEEIYQVHKLKSTNKSVQLCKLYFRAINVTLFAPLL